MICFCHTKFTAKLHMNAIKPHKLKMKDWDAADLPREKLLSSGPRALTDAELLAILLRSGNREETALDLAKKLIPLIRDNANHCHARDLMPFKGIGEAKAITIIAAIELGRRLAAIPPRDNQVIRSSRDAYDVIKTELEGLPHEEFWIILLNRAHVPMRKHRVSSGGVSGTVVDSKMVFKEALTSLACSLILCHNHPSGNLKPSQADIQLTEKIRNAAKVFDIQLLDHLIIGNREYFSFADEGLL